MITSPSKYAKSRLLSARPSLKGVLYRIAALLSTPVFAYLPRVRQSSLSKEELDDCTRILAWTAPFAILALYRCITRCQTDCEVDIEADSMDLEEADEGIVTDHEEFGSIPEPPVVPTHVSQVGLNEARESEQRDENLVDDISQFSMSAIQPEDLDD
jgi:hypothetical protein